MGAEGTGSFQVEAKDPHSLARAARLKTAHGWIETPVFMPVGTQATVKTVSVDELDSLSAQIVLSNAYHLYLRPGTEIIRKAGGLHAFMAWPKPILTDSGGYQIFSLREVKKITREGLSFKSHLDGSSHFLTPETVICIQRDLGSDIWMPLDHCTAYPCAPEDARDALTTTLDWAERSQAEWRRGDASKNLLFGIVQGGVYADLRKRSLEGIAGLDFSGLAIGGLSVGEPQSEMLKILDALGAQLPAQKPHYLMGVGYPDDLLSAVERGIDMFDCVVPTRNGRNGTVFYSGGKLILTNREFAEDFSPIDSQCGCFTCRTHTRAYLRHLFLAKEMLGLRLASLHNLSFFIELLQRARRALLLGRFQEYKRDCLKHFSERKEP